MHKMPSSLLLSGLVAVLIACSLAKPFENGYTKTKEPRIKKVEFNGKILEIPVDDVDPFHRETPADEGYSPGAYETDMILNKEQKEAITSTGGIRSKRKAIQDTTRHWPKDSAGFVIVHYEFNTTKVVDKTAVQAAMAHWQDQTCVSFVETSDTSKNRLSFFKGQGCYSYIGMQSGKQQVSIGDGCTRLGTVSHEIGHALGFYHEQSRPDRDDFVTVNTANIKEGYGNNFDKCTESKVMTELNVDYDYSSAMHYGPYGFGIESTVPTLLPKDPFAMGVIGQREALSFFDVKLFNLMYMCDESCTGASPCQNKGFRTKDCTCRCPSGWTGSQCQTADNANTGPVTEITLTAASGEVASPNYDGTNNYPLSTSVMTYIKGGPGEQIHLTFDFFDFEAYDTGNAKCWDYLEIKADNVYYGGIQYCGSTSPPDIVASEIMLSFHSDNSVAKRGFHGTYTKTTTGISSTTQASSSSTTTQASTTVVVTCPQAVKETCTSTIDLAVGCSATITSPNFPNNYPNSQQCIYTINAPTGTTITLTMDSFDTENGYDVVDVHSSSGSAIRRSSGSSLPAPLSTPTRMYVVFTSDGSVTEKGFSATLTATA